MNEKRTLEDRVTQLESVVAHLQYDVEKLNEVLVEQQAALTAFKQQISELLVRLDSEVADDGP